MLVFRSEKSVLTFKNPTRVRHFGVRRSAIELETSSQPLSPAVMNPYTWSASLLLPGEVDLFAVVSVVASFYRMGVLAPSPTHLRSHPALGPAMAELILLQYEINEQFLFSLLISHSSIAI